MHKEDKIVQMTNRIHRYWKDHSEEIEAAGETDGSNYILKMLYKAINFNSMASSRTVTCKTAHDVQVESERQQQMGICQDCIAAAICELIDQDYERRLEEADSYWDV